jgi:clan AA aspartic protease (TIGR02281 family)
MNSFLTLALIAGGLSSYVVAQTPRDASLKQMYDTHSWFELRDAARDKNLPALYLGAIASAFNRVQDAEKHLNRAIREASNAEAANDARGMLAMLYIRAGRTADAGCLIDDILKVAPERSDIRNARQVFGAVSDGRNQRVQFGSVTFRCDVSDGVRMPLSVNGQPVSWLLDTGANIGMVSEAEARRVGLDVHDSTGQASDLAGGTTRIRTAQLGRMVIGGTEIRDVPVIVLPESQPPWNELPAGKQGIIGLPVALALEPIRWTKSGACQTGRVASREHGSHSNLVFDQFNLLVRVESERRPLDFIFDTGNQRETQLWERFARDFSGLVKEQGSKGTVRITQIGGSSERDVTVVPEVRLHVGGFDAFVRPAHVFSKPVVTTRITETSAWTS